LIYVVGGLALAIFYTAAALGIAIWQTDLQWFGDITLACQVTLSPLDQCRLDTIAVGWETLAGLCLAALMLIATLLLPQGRQTVNRWALPPNTFERSILYRLFIIGVLTLLCAHFFTRITGQDQLGRLAMIEREGIFTSLENLCWPILLQLYVTDRSRIGRYFALTLLLVIASLAFFRGTLLLILIFGIGFYLLEFIWRTLNRRNHWKRYRPILTERLIIGIVVSLLLIPAVITDSASRKAYVLSGQSTTDISSAARQPTSSLQTPDPNITQKPLLPTGLGERQILQRIMSPLYHASMARKLADTVSPPTAWDGLARKLRLSNQPNLNEHLYHAIYPSHPAGQTTSLFFGEGAAWSSTPPLFWIVSAVLFLFLLALAGERVGIPIGLLVGLAIWRGYTGGLIDILPSLMLQILAITLIAKPWMKRVGALR